MSEPMSEEGFRLGGLPALSRSTALRDEPLRDDVARQRRMWPEARVLEVDRRSRIRAVVGQDSATPAYRPAPEVAAEPPAHAVLLGEDGGRAYWAVRAESSDAGGGDWRVWTAEPSEQEQWLDLRAVGPLLSDTDAGMVTTAVGTLYWHAHGRFCANCGAPTEPARAGWARDCTGCGKEEYPRTDPAVIVLVHDGGDRVLLARQPSWPAGRYSVLAGFVEVGEAAEATVAREVHEEVGVHVREVRYLGSQPWPFPRSLMLGFAAVANPGEPLAPADGEIESARWFHRDELRTALKGEDDGLLLPGGSSIALTMLEAWAG